MIRCHCTFANLFVVSLVVQFFECISSCTTPLYIHDIIVTIAVSKHGLYMMGSSNYIACAICSYALVPHT